MMSPPLLCLVSFPQVHNGEGAPVQQKRTAAFPDHGEGGG
jgi:hypothetical protein